MIITFKHIRKLLLKAFALWFFLFISDATLSSDFSYDYSNSFNNIVVSEIVKTDALIPDLYLTDFNSGLLSIKVDDRLISVKNKFFISVSNSKLNTAYDRIQRRYLNYKPTLIMASNPILSPDISYDDDPSVS